MLDKLRFVYFFCCVLFAEGSQLHTLISYVLHKSRLAGKASCKSCAPFYFENLVVPQSYSQAELFVENQTPLLELNVTSLEPHHSEGGCRAENVIAPLFKENNPWGIPSPVVLLFNMKHLCLIDQWKNAR